MSAVLEQLAAPFPASDVRKDPQGNHYIPIDQVQDRLDSVLGTEWNLRIVDVQGPTLLPTDQVTYGRNKKPAFTGRVTVEVEATIDGHVVRRAGVGADLADDPDKVMKTALANAIKKAGNQFGIARYLWDEDERKAVDNAKAAIKGNDKALQREAFKLAKKLTGKDEPTKAEAAKALGIKVAELVEADVLQRVLREHGVL